MLGVWMNFLAVLVGGFLGSRIRGGFPVKIRDTINLGLALAVVVIGISGAIQTENALILIVSLAVGSLLGEWIDIEKRLESLGAWAERKLPSKEGGLMEAFVTTTLIVCVGSMAIVGSLEAGLRGDSSTLLAKSALDFTACIIFGSTMGTGVMLASAPILIYQGGIALLAHFVSGLLTGDMIREISAVGSTLIVALGINMLEVRSQKIRVGNMLPSVLVPIFWYLIANLFS